MELYKDLPVIDVQNTNDNVKIIFLDQGKNEIHEVILNKKAYNPETKQFVESEDKQKQVEKWCEDYFGLPSKRMKEAIGQTHDVYAYDGYDSLWESDKKFSDDMLNQIVEAYIKEVQLNPNGIRIRYEYDGSTYASNMSFTQRVNNQDFVNPQKKTKQLKRFEDKFLVPIEERDSLIGKKIMVEVKKAMGKYIYGDIKDLPKR